MDNKRRNDMWLFGDENKTTLEKIAEVGMHCSAITTIVFLVLWAIEEILKRIN